MRRISVTGNRLGGTLDPDIFKYWRSVRSIDLSNNSFEGEAPLTVSHCLHTYNVAGGKDSPGPSRGPEMASRPLPGGPSGPPGPPLLSRKIAQQ